jgi:hypothetical protein
MQKKKYSHHVIKYTYQQGNNSPIDQTKQGFGVMKSQAISNREIIYQVKGKLSIIRNTINLMMYKKA